MPYLGPRAFKTAPLTSHNLEYLNDRLVESQIKAGQQPDRIVGNPPVTTTPTAHVAPVSDENVTQYAARAAKTSSQRPQCVTTTHDSASLSSNSYDSSPKGEDEEGFTISTPLSSISSSSHSNSYESVVSAVNYSDPTSGLVSSSQLDAHTIVPDDDKTVVSGVAGRGSPSPGFQFSDADTDSYDDKPALLRKKSGELIKSSLKLPTLQRSNSLPNTKSVRFATRLEDIKFFHKTEKPTAVSNNSSPVQSPNVRPTIWDWDDPLSGSSSDDEGDFPAEEHWTTVENDCAPVSSGALNFSRFNTGRPVILESIKLNSFKTALIGFVYVRNICYQKKIIVRLTTDDWKSYVEIDSANYICSNNIFKYSDEQSNYDKFSFIIKLGSLCNFNQLLDIQFCIEYVAGPNVYWDNNDGKNYHLVLKNETTVPSQVAKQPASSASLDLDDVAFRLKANHNFNDSFNRPVQKFVFHPKNSRNYMMKKIRSESSLASLDLPTASSPIEHASHKSLSLNNSAASKSYTTAPVSASAVPSPRLQTGGFDSPEDYYDYNQIVKNFCFYGSVQKPASLTNTSQIVRHTSPEPHDTLTADLSSFA